MNIGNIPQQYRPNPSSQPQKQPLSPQQLWRIFYKFTEDDAQRPQKVQQLLQLFKPTINEPLSADGKTILHHSCIRGCLPLVEGCLLREGNPNSTDCDGRSPLFYASSVDNYKVFKLLVSFGANPLQVNRGNQTPLTKACLFASSHIIKWYQRDCPEAFRVRDKCGSQPLDYLRITSKKLYTSAVSNSNNTNQKEKHKTKAQVSSSKTLRVTNPFNEELTVKYMEKYCLSGSGSAIIYKQTTLQSTIL